MIYILSLFKKLGSKVHIYIQPVAFVVGTVVVHVVVGCCRFDVVGVIVVVCFVVDAVVSDFVVVDAIIVGAVVIGADVVIVSAISYI